MARPSSASLNSLAKLLRQVQPLYTECRLILNYLDPNEAAQSPQLPEAVQSHPEGNSTNKDAGSVSLTVFERRLHYGKRIV